MQKIVRRPILNPKQRNRIKLLFYLLIILIAIIVVGSFFGSIANPFSGGGKFVTLNTQKCISSESIIRCSQNVTYTENGLISVVVIQDMPNTTIYNAAFACLGGIPSINYTKAKYSGITNSHNSTIPNNASVLVSGIQCYQGNTSVTFTPGTQFYGLLWINYSESPKGSPSYIPIGQIQIGIKK
jgi:uncharacterized protein (UPF0333 family)